MKGEGGEFRPLIGNAPGKIVDMSKVSRGGSNDPFLMLKLSQGKQAALVLVLLCGTLAPVVVFLVFVADRRASCCTGADNKFNVVGDNKGGEGSCAGIVLLFDDWEARVVATECPIS